MAKDNKTEVVPVERTGPTPDFSIPPARKKLPKELQDTLDSEEKMWETMYEGKYVHHKPHPSDISISSHYHTTNPIAIQL
jgi:hypothetical protein